MGSFVYQAADDLFEESMKSRMITLIAIGFTSEYHVYVNVPRDEAIRRYNEACPWAKVGEHEYTTVKEFTIADEFWAYDVDVPQWNLSPAVDGPE